jgi:23S rRNA (adenine2503-C2)-methyltransferase
MTIELKDLTLEELKKELARRGIPEFRASQVFHWMYKQQAANFWEMNNLPRETIKLLEENYSLSGFISVKEFVSADGSRKYLLKLKDSNQIETVYIPAVDRHTICVSTQVGCKFGCAMCASGLKSFVRNLTVAEIIDQLMYVQKQNNIRITNMVFMGMGEPLDNYANVTKAITIINSPDGPEIAARKITISTAGFIPGIRDLADFDLQVNLSLSLHATTDKQRETIMPITRKYSIKDLVNACQLFFQKTGRIITLEYVLLKGVNDAMDDAKRLSDISRAIKGKVNLLAFNPTPELKCLPASNEEIERFRGWVEKNGTPVTVRVSRGADIGAACGQLIGKDK